MLFFLLILLLLLVLLLLLFVDSGSEGVEECRARLMSTLSLVFDKLRDDSERTWSICFVVMYLLPTTAPNGEKLSHITQFTVHCLNASYRGPHERGRKLDHAARREGGNCFCSLFLLFLNNILTSTERSGKFRLSKLPRQAV